MISFQAEPRKRRSYRDDSFTDDALTYENKSKKTAPKKINSNIKKGADEMNVQKNVSFDKNRSSSPKNQIYNEDDYSDEDDGVYEPEPLAHHKSQSTKKNYLVDRVDAHKLKESLAAAFDKHTRTASNYSKAKERSSHVTLEKTEISGSAKTSSKINCVSAIIIISIAIAGAVYFFDGFSVLSTYYESSDSEHQKKVRSILDDVQTSLRNIKSKYKNQDENFWQDAYISIAEIIRKPHKPSILLLVGDKADPTDCLAVLLGNISSNALSSHSLLLTPEKFKTDMGSVIESLRVSIQNNKAVVSTFEKVIPYEKIFSLFIPSLNFRLFGICSILILRP